MVIDKKIGTRSTRNRMERDYEYLASSTRRTNYRPYYIFLGVVGVIVVLVALFSRGGNSNSNDPLILQASGTESGPFEAVCVINIGNPGVTGTIILKQEKGVETVGITGEIKGLKPNTVHGFHIHESGDVRKGCNSTGSHFNPFNEPHGGPTDLKRHVGDLGNIIADVSGVAKIDIQDKLVSLVPGNERCVLSRAFVIHSDADDLGKGGYADSKTTGHAGSRIGCGVIGIVNSPKLY